MYCSDLAPPLLYIPVQIIRVRVYIDIFMTLYISYYLTVTQTATQTLTFGYIKWTPDVDSTGSFLDIMFDQYARRGMRKKTSTKTIE